VRALATEFRRLLLAPGPFALGGFRFRPDIAAGQLDQFDRFFARLFDAGFDEKLVALATTFVSQVVFTAARDEALARESGRHPQDQELVRAIEQRPATELPNLRRYVAAGAHGDPDEQFAFNLDCAIAGLEAELARRSRARGRRRPTRQRRTNS
jgi:hypothetical protein